MRGQVGQAGKAETFSLVCWEWYLTSSRRAAAAQCKPSGFGVTGL